MDVIERIESASTVWEVINKLSIKDLESALAVASNAYYNTSRALLDDATYDILFWNVFVSLVPRVKSLLKSELLSKERK